MYFRVGAGGAGYEIYLTTSDTSLYGVTLTLSKSGTTVGTAVVDNQGKAKFTVKETGTYTITFTSQGTTYTETVEVSAYEVEIEAGFQFKRWLGLTDLDPDDYSSLADVLADEKAVRQLMTVHASVDYLASFTSDDTSVVTILNNDLAAKWITCTAYAEDVLTDAYSALMESIGKYGYGKWVEINNVWQPLGNVPIMTSNTAPYGEASASSTLSGRDAYRAFNGDSATDWESTATTGTQRLYYKFATPTDVKKAKIQILESGVSVRLQYSDDGSTWHYASAAVSPTAYVDTNITADADHGYHMLWGVEYSRTDSGNHNYNTNTLQFYGRQMTVSVPKMTSNVLPYGEASANAEYSADLAAWKAFMNDPAISKSWSPTVTSGTTPNTGWIKYDFGNKVKLGFVLIFTRSADSWTGSIEGYDGEDWETIHTISTPQTGNNYPSISTSHIYAAPVTTAKAYTAFRFTSTSFRVGGTGSGYSEPNVNMVQFFGFDYSEKEWDTEYPRKYIYDNGVELETITTSGTVTKNPNCLTLASQNAQASVTLDTTSYNLLRAFVGQHASGTNTLICGAGTATFIAANMPFAQGLDVSNVNGDSATGVKQTSAGVFDCEAVWLE